MTLYCTSEDVINFTQITPVKLGIDTKKEPNKLETIITKWIQHASSLIDQYTKNPKKENEIPPVYENVCIRNTKAKHRCQATNNAEKKTKTTKEQKRNNKY